eukprot:1309797-Amphidinium_carterae.1
MRSFLSTAVRAQAPLTCCDGGGAWERRETLHNDIADLWPALRLYSGLFLLCAGVGCCAQMREFRERL